MLTPLSKSSVCCLSCTNLASGLVAFTALIPFLLVNLLISDGCDFLRIDNLNLLKNGPQVYLEFQHVQEKCSREETLEGTSLDYGIITSDIIDNLDWKLDIDFKFVYQSNL